MKLQEWQWKTTFNPRLEGKGDKDPRKIASGRAEAVGLREQVAQGGEVEPAKDDATSPRERGRAETVEGGGGDVGEDGGGEPVA